MLEQVTREARGTGPVAGPGDLRVSADSMAKPFTAFRRFFAAEPDPEIVRRLLLAGYRKPYHADIFLGSRLAVPAVLGLAVALVFSQNTIIFFLLALVVGFLCPDFWLSHAIKQEADTSLKLSLPDGLDLVVDLPGSRTGPGSRQSSGSARNLK